MGSPSLEEVLKDIKLMMVSEITELVVEVAHPTVAKISKEVVT